MENSAAMPLIVLVLFRILTFRFVLGDVEVDFRAVPPIVKPLETVNATLQCTANERIQYYNSAGGYYYDVYGRQRLQTNPPPGNDNVASIFMIRIVKNRQDKWRPIAQIMSGVIVQTLDSSITSASGLISSTIKSRSFLEVKWAVATADAFGKYRCDVVRFDTNQNAVLTSSSEIDLSNNLNAHDLLLMLQYDATRILEKVDTLETSQKSNQNLTDQLKHDLLSMETENMDTHNELVETIKKEHKILGNQGEGLENRIADMEKEITERVEEINTKVKVVIESGFFMLWPRGSYGLLKPNSNCPSQELAAWKSGSWRHHTESTDRNQDAVSPENHLWEPVLEREQGKNFVTQHFCIMTESHSFGPSWPKGTYCINKKLKCPHGFIEGYFRWDEEDDSFLQTGQGELPDGIFNDSESTDIEYCCRKDSPANVPLYLPNSEPFYLYRYEGSCQQVYGMNVTEEYIVFDTENTNNDDELGPVHPDGKINNIRLELCYYQQL